MKWGKWDTLTPEEQLVVAKVFRKASTKLGSVSLWPVWALNLIETLDLGDVITDADFEILHRVVNER